MNGVRVIAKPAGKTSHDVVASVRHSLPRGVRVGHAGTLDPFATGVLLILVGRATRAQRWLLSLPKTYRAVARLGWTSDTGDRDGRLVRTGRVPEELDLPVGDLMQRPPAYSAVKVDGERAYRRARRGEEVEPALRPITVHRFELLWRDGDRVGLELEVSSGTYVRTLVADLGDAYCEELERTAVGHFRLEDADPAHTIPLEEALGFLPERPLDAAEARRVRHGQPVGRSLGAEAVRLTHDGRVLALGEPRGGGLHPTVVFHPA
ncbi:MAG: tRNA pseudouridine(55) synthase TruB [Actinomycetota bacterium]|nr:tRNA pseudouridine(55) synthase TruB [Actinomycetota bacterium]